MSKIAVSGNASGTGTLTIAAPNTNSDRTLTLPDTTAPILAGSGITLSASAPANTLVTDAAGHVLIGLASSVGGTNGAALQVKGTTGSSDFSIALMDGDTTVAGKLHLESSGSNSISLQADPDNLAASTYLGFGVDGTERARITDSGNFLLGQTSSGARFAITQPFADWCININTTSSGTQYFSVFRYNGNTVGQIFGNNTNTTYSTSSDYRLKHDIQPMTGALAKVAALKPCTYKWNLDDSTGEGFIAHELAEVCPSAVVGDKDAVNEDGSIKPQGIDTSFLVATLTAAIQELNAKVDAQAAEIAALKGQA